MRVFTIFSQFTDQIMNRLIKKIITDDDQTDDREELKRLVD